MAGAALSRKPLQGSAAVEGLPRPLHVLFLCLAKPSEPLVSTEMTLFF